MRIFFFGLVLLALHSLSVAGRTPEQIKQLMDSDFADSARWHLTHYNEKNLFNPKTFLTGLLETDGKEAFKKFKSLESASMEPIEKQEAFYRIAHYYYIKESVGMAISYFRKAILAHPEGELFEQAHYWMGVTCLQYGKGKKAYLDSANNHFNTLANFTPKEKWYGLGLMGIAKVRYAKKEYASIKSILDLAKDKASPQHAGLIYHTAWEMANEITNEIGNETTKEAVKDFADSTSRKILEAQMHAYFPHGLETQLVPYASLPDSLSKKGAPDSTHLQRVSLKKDEKLRETAKNPPQDSTVSIQLAAFTVKSYAEEYLQKLGSTISKAQVVEELRKNTPYYMVRILGFADKSTAEEFAESHLKLKGISYYLVHTN